MNRTEPQSYQEHESLPARAAAVLRSPRALFTRLAIRPRWAAMLLLTTAVSAAAGAGFLATGVGRQALVDQWERTALAFGDEVDDAQYEDMQRMSAYAVPYGLASAAARGPLLAFGVAAVIALAYGGSRRRGRRYAHALAIAAHAGVILALRDLVAAPLNYARETLAPPFTAGLLFRTLDSASPAARFLGLIDLFAVWWVVVLALGVSTVFERDVKRTVLVFLGTYVALALLLAGVMALTGGTA